MPRRLNGFRGNPTQAREGGSARRFDRVEPPSDLSPVHRLWEQGPVPELRLDAVDSSRAGKSEGHAESRELPGCWSDHVIPHEGDVRESGVGRCRSMSEHASVPVAPTQA